jgi:hypothetical protein
MDQTDPLVIDWWNCGLESCWLGTAFFEPSFTALKKRLIETAAMGAIYVA